MDCFSGLEKQIDDLVVCAIDGDLQALFVENRKKRGLQGREALKPQIIMDSHYIASVDCRKRHIIPMQEKFGHYKSELDEIPF